jgi:hypothetical protein
MTLVDFQKYPEIPIEKVLLLSQFHNKNWDSEY